jgi:hypothetical protein
MRCAGRIRRLIDAISAAPAAHFALIGAALFLVTTRFPAGGGRDAAEDPIVITRTDVELLRRGWSEQAGALPDRAEVAALVDRAIDDEVLYREAMAAGIDRQSPVVSDRLARLASFVGEESPQDSAALEAEARRLGLARHDLVVRRHLTATMRLALATPSYSDWPNEGELRAYYERDGSRTDQAEKVRFTHVYLTADRRGSALWDDARRILRQLPASPSLEAPAGDPFIRGAEIGPATAVELERIFGPDFAPAIANVATGVWAGPIESAYGLHLVWIHGRSRPTAPALERVRSQVLHGYLAEQGARRLRQRLDQLRARYEIIVEP